jgi:CRP-like cAMP-binding protein
MSIQNADLFKGLMVLNEISMAVVAETYDEGTIIYSYKDPANYFYSLIDGTVQLTLGQEAQIVYTVNRIGEIFGWSSMVGRESYTTIAKCVVPTKVNKISKQRLNQIFEKYPRDGMLFYKRLAGAVVQRLIDSHSAFLSVESPHAGTVTAVTTVLRK